MTQLILEDVTSLGEISISEIETGYWYRIYDPDPWFEGKIGIATWVNDDKTLILLDGSHLNNDSIRVKQINRVSIKIYD